MKKIIFLLLSCIVIQNSIHAMQRTKQALTPSDLLIKDIENNNIEGVEELLRIKDFNVNQPDSHGHIPLHIAIAQDKVEIAKLLLKHGANPNQQDATNKDRSPLHIAASNGNENLVRLLLTHLANVNLQDNAGNSPLYYAVVFNKPEIIQLLLHNKANAILKNKRGETAISAAIALKNDGIRQMIENHILRQEQTTAILRGFMQEESRTHEQSPLNLLPRDKEILKDILSKI